MSKTYEQMTDGEKSRLVENVAAAHLLANMKADLSYSQSVDLTKMLIKAEDSFSLTDEQVEQVSEEVWYCMQDMVETISLTAKENSQPAMVEIAENYDL